MTKVIPLREADRPPSHKEALVQIQMICAGTVGPTSPAMEEIGRIAAKALSEDYAR